MNGVNCDVGCRHSSGTARREALLGSRTWMVIIKGKIVTFFITSLLMRSVACLLPCCGHTHMDILYLPLGVARMLESERRKGLAVRKRRRKLFLNLLIAFGTVPGVGHKITKIAYPSFVDV